MNITNITTTSDPVPATSEIGVIGLAVMGQNLALNIAEKGFPVSVYNRSYEKTELAQLRADKEGIFVCVYEREGTVLMLC